MISKRVGISPKNDNYARLAEYIADAGHEGEKSLMHWCAGCLGDDDYQHGISEAVDVQAMNTRSRQSKTYHLVISFRPEDEAKLTPEVFKAIEERFAAALGYTEHQRHCGVHKNTANLHMHMAYNMIHPERHIVIYHGEHTVYSATIKRVAHEIRRPAVVGGQRLCHAPCLTGQTAFESFTPLIQVHQAIDAPYPLVIPGCPPWAAQRIKQLAKAPCGLFIGQF